MLPLLQELQHLVKACTHPSFITHIHAYLHSGYIAEGNKQDYALTCPIFTSPEQEHQHPHANAHRLHVQ